MSKASLDERHGPEPFCCRKSRGGRGAFRGMPGAVLYLVPDGGGCGWAMGVRHQDVQPRGARDSMENDGRTSCDGGWVSGENKALLGPWMIQPCAPQGCTGTAHGHTVTHTDTPSPTRQLLGGRGRSAKPNEAPNFFPRGLQLFPAHGLPELVSGGSRGALSLGCSRHLKLRKA